MSLDLGEWRWLLAFVVGSAVVGPVVLRPPLWDEYRRQQLVGFIIGMVAWSFSAALTLQYGVLY